MQNRFTLQGCFFMKTTVIETMISTEGETLNYVLKQIGISEAGVSSNKKLVNLRNSSLNKWL